LNKSNGSFFRLSNKSALLKTPIQEKTVSQKTGFFLLRCKIISPPIPPKKLLGPTKSLACLVPRVLELVPSVLELVPSVLELVPRV
jgi:hypothetical protein